MKQGAQGFETVKTISCNVYTVSTFLLYGIMNPVIFWSTLNINK